MRKNSKISKKKKKLTNKKITINEIEIDKKNIININNKIESLNSEEKEKKTINNEFNNIVYFGEKNREFYNIFLSVFYQKIEIIQFIFFPDDYTSRFMLFNLYTISLYIDLLMNCILYNDYAISQKYHNEGTLEFITSLVISLFSNILTSVLIYFIKYLMNYHNYIKVIIRDIKSISNYLMIILRLFKIIKYKFYCLLFLEILLGLFMVYYLFIFGVINSKSINSFLVNYVLSMINSLIYSIVVTFIVSLFRKFSFVLKTKRLYIISLYLDEHF